VTEPARPDERGWELTRLVLRTLALVQVGLVLAAMLAPVTRTVEDQPDPLSAPGLFLALSNVAEPGDHSEDHLFAMIASGVVVAAVVGLGIVALLVGGAVWYPGRLPLLTWLLAGLAIVGTLALLGATNSIHLESLGADKFELDDGASGGPAWGLWLPIAAAAWAINLARGVQRLAE
jgi:hypothetical protein